MDYSTMIVENLACIFALQIMQIRAEDFCKLFNVHSQINQLIDQKIKVFIATVIIIVSKMPAVITEQAAKTFDQA